MEEQQEVELTFDEIESIILSIVDNKCEPHQTIRIDGGYPIKGAAINKILTTTLTYAKEIYRVSQGLAIMRNQNKIGVQGVKDAIVICSKGINESLDLKWSRG